MLHTNAPSGRRAQRRAERIDAILTAALRIAADDGLEALTIQSLARAMDWSVGALYRYYRGKDALLVAMQQRVLTGLTARLRVRRTSAVAPLPSILAMVDGFRRFAEEEPVGFSLIVDFLGPRVVLPDVEDARRVGDSMRPLLEEIGEAIHLAADAGHLRLGDPVDRTLVLWAGLQGILQMGKLGRIEPRLEGRTGLLVRTLTDSLLLGWGADPAALTDAHASMGVSP